MWSVNWLGFDAVYCSTRPSNRKATQKSYLNSGFVMSAQGVLSKCCWLCLSCIRKLPTWWRNCIANQRVNSAYLKMQTRRVAAEQSDEQWHEWWAENDFTCSYYVRKSGIAPWFSFVDQKCDTGSSSSRGDWVTGARSHWLPPCAVQLLNWS